MKPSTSIGFNAGSSEDYSLRKLREAWSAVGDALKNIEQVKQSLEARNFGLAEGYLDTAKWNASRAREAIAIVGKSGKLS
jgi:hypothetical protein